MRVNFFNRLTISARLLTLIGIAAGGTFLLVAFTIFTIRGVIIQGQAQKLDAINDTSVTLVRGLYEQVTRGELTETEAQQRAIALLDGIR
ncbi:hypothetical protein [Aliidiomarina celeris]|uniref:hypothetical protein n=1 Tax=Aliidiomarina celeris TaxID=2249428 RepID=UPI001E4592C1|nr:hypothetical protein [Aliidiomarina celeris]